MKKPMPHVPKPGEKYPVWATATGCDVNIKVDPKHLTLYRELTGARK